MQPRVIDSIARTTEEFLYQVSSYIQNGQQPQIQPADVLLLHGWAQRNPTFHKLLPYLKDRNISFCAPNYPWKHDVDTIIEGTDTFPGIDAIVDQMQPPVSILGYSYGGLIAKDYALQHPEKVEKLVLVASPLDGTFAAEIPYKIGKALGIADHNLGGLRDMYFDAVNAKYLINTQIPPHPILTVLGRRDELLWPHSTARINRAEENRRIHEIFLPRGTHIDTIYHPTALEIIADFLKGDYPST